MKGFLKFVAYWLFCIFCGLYSSIKYVFTGTSTAIRVLITMLYSGLCVSAFAFPLFVYILTVLYLIATCIFSIMIVKDNENINHSEDDNMEKPHQAWFEGMSVEEAKKEYRRLMKEYHPDSINGNLEIAQQIAEAYSKYCAAYGR